MRRHATKTPWSDRVTVSAMGDPVTVHVLLFASLAERAGARSVEVQLPGGTPVAGVWGYLPQAITGGVAPPQAMRWAVNGAWAAPGVPLAGGDEVAVLTPVSGG